MYGGDCYYRQPTRPGPKRKKVTVTISFLLFLLFIITVIVVLMYSICICMYLSFCKSSNPGMAPPAGLGKVLSTLLPPRLSAGCNFSGDFSEAAASRSNDPKSQCLATEAHHIRVLSLQLFQLKLKPIK